MSLPQSIEQKLQRIQSLKAEIDQLSREVESEYYSPERLSPSGKSMLV